jgi:MFS family permease
MPPAVHSSDATVEKSLRHSLKDAAAYAAMIGAGETYISAFALFLRASTPQIGLLASLPALLASFAQLLSAWIGRLTGHRKSIVLVGASLQALAWLPIAALPILYREAAVPLLIASVVLYQCGAHLATPQWGSLMGDIVPERRRGRFFALRTRIVTLITFVSLLAGGVTLHLFNIRGATQFGFLLVFGVAMLARLVSVYHLSRMHDPRDNVAAMEVPIGSGWWRRLRASNFVRFSMFFALMQFAVAIASPFFAVYMLRDLHFSYVQFMGNTGISILAQFLTLNQWGRISDVFGNRRILSATGILVPLMPLLWIVSSNYWYLLMAQAVSGLVWAGFSLSASNFLYDLIAKDKRATYLAIHNVLAATGIFVGAMLGGYLGTKLPASLDLFGISWVWLSPLIGVFAISTAFRAIVVAVLLPRIREVRKVRPISFQDVIFRVTRVNVLAGVFFDIIGPKPKSSGGSTKPD